jgi:hypothetical protein
MHRTTPQFWKYFDELPASVQSVAKKNFELLKLDSMHPSLHFKKIGKFWSIRAGSNHRALATEDGVDYVWVWIGAHDEYQRIIKEMA